jgi:glycosyltransferase involved in cell wall biosynthesis
MAGSRDDVPRILRELDIFVLPSLGEGISNTILEAMASGLPVVATKVGGNQELVEEGRTGTLVPAGEPEALANALRTYVDSPNVGKYQGKMGRRRVEDMFSLASMIKSYKKLYDSELSTNRKKWIRTYT